MSSLAIQRKIAALLSTVMLLICLAPASVAQSRQYDQPLKSEGGAPASINGSGLIEYSKPAQPDSGVDFITPPSHSDDEDDDSGVDFITPPSHSDDEDDDSGVDFITPPSHDDDDDDSGVDFITPPSHDDDGDDDSGVDFITPPSYDDDEDDDSGVDFITPPSHDDDEDDDSGVEFITPPSHDDDDDDGPLVEFIKPSSPGSSSAGVLQFALTPVVSGRSVSARITGASSREVEVLLLDQNGRQITSASRIGSGLVALGRQAPGQYILLARYVTPTENTQAQSAIITVNANSSSSSGQTSGNTSGNTSGSTSGNTSDYPILQRGERNHPMLFSLQQRLKELGYYTIKVDGIYGSGTQRAVRDFQRMNGLRITGIADAQTQRLLHSSSAVPASAGSSGQSTGYRLLYWGCEGSAVIRLQNALIAAGYKQYVRIVDGIYGQWTYDAVRAYQKDHGLSVDGIAGKNTQNSLYGTHY